MQIMRDEMKLVSGRSGGRFPRKRLCFGVFRSFLYQYCLAVRKGEVSGIHRKPLAEVNMLGMVIGVNKTKVITVYARSHAVIGSKGNDGMRSSCISVGCLAFNTAMCPCDARWQKTQAKAPGDICLGAIANICKYCLVPCPKCSSPVNAAIVEATLGAHYRRLVSRWCYSV